MRVNELKKSLQRERRECCGNSRNHAVEFRHSDRFAAIEVTRPWALLGCHAFRGVWDAPGVSSWLTVLVLVGEY